MKFAELSALYHQPLFDLISQSRAVHLRHWRGEEVQRCTLLSIKTGGCGEDCAYCAQSAHYSTGVEREDLLSHEVVMAVARRARSQGATRFCMGAAWRGVHDGSGKFERVLEIVRQVSSLGMEVCVTLGEIGPAEARNSRLLELLLTITTSPSELQFSSFENSGFFRHSSFAFRHFFRERLTLKNLGSTSATHFAMKVPGASGLNKNLNRDIL